MAEPKSGWLEPGPLTDVLKRHRGTFLTIGIFSAVVNILMLAGPLFMLQVYDRVLTSQSVPTLIALSIFVIAAYAFQGVLDVLRQRIAVRLASVFDESLEDIIHRAVMRLALVVRGAGEALSPIRHIDTIRSFATSAGPTALLDAPWVPFYLILCFVINPWLGVLALLGSIVLGVIAVMTERASRASVRKTSQQQGVRSGVIEGDRANAETVRAMGMQPQLLARWRQVNSSYLTAVESSADVVNSFSAITRIFRMALQSAMLGLGAYLVILGDLSAGAMIAASIMMGRALNPIEVAVGNWRGFIGAQDAYGALNRGLADLAERDQVTELPAPSARLDIEGLAVLAPKATKPVLQGIGFSLQAGEVLGLIGPSGAGKTSLARVLVGIWPPARGTVRLDGAEINQWTPEALGKSIGFLAQDVDLFEGTIAQNIARMSAQPDSKLVLAAAKAAGAHDMILNMPQGYDSQIGEGGSVLSAGQRQRIALARALYGDPFLIVLDEPQSNLDAEGEQALLRAMQSARERGAIVIVISHRPSTLANADKVLVVANGTQQTFGPREEVMRQLAGQPANIATRDAGQSRPDGGDDDQHV